MFKLKSLQQRLVLFMLLPVTVLLIGMGIAGFVYTRESILEQWGEAAILKLQRAAHHVDMRLSGPRELLKIMQNNTERPFSPLLREVVLERLRQMEGVARVDLTWQSLDTVQAAASAGHHHAGGMPGQRRFRMAGPVDVTPPRYDDLVENETVSLVSDLKNASGDHMGRLEVVLRFDELVHLASSAGWWHGQKVLLVDDSGKILSGSAAQTHKQLGETKDPLELKTLAAIQKDRSGTVFGAGHPPEQVAGFYRLMEAPWTLVLVASGKDVLAPIVKFRFYYGLVGSVFIVLILVLIRVVTGRTVASIRRVSRAADQVARGHYDRILPPRTEDEVGELIRSFNTMVHQLKERTQLKEALNLAMEVQQNLLPKQAPVVEGLDIAAAAYYCDETGGDYYDFLVAEASEPQQLGIVVGDVSEHGLPSALLMASLRAALRQRAALPGDIGQVVTDVNRQLTRDVQDSGRFATLFYLSIQHTPLTIQWVRAGHDPAIFFDPGSGHMQFLNGPGMALGVDGTASYEQSNLSQLAPGQVIVLGTDGVWETRNAHGEMFGKAAVCDLIRRHAEGSAAHIQRAIIEALDRFRGQERYEDDVTLVVVKLQEAFFR